MAGATTNNVDGARVTAPFSVSFMTDAPTFEVLCKGLPAHCGFASTVSS
jgi:hypothetical protein